MIALMGPELTTWLMTSTRRPLLFSAHAHLPYRQARFVRYNPPPPTTPSCKIGFASYTANPSLHCIFYQAGPSAILIRNMWLGSGAVDPPLFFGIWGIMHDLRDFNTHERSLAPDLITLDYG